ncbi:hypothetical protein LWI28_007385 [Acer negundo]|uniref:Serine hydroxymethyltransferase-like domain-containing protein n=1 Tax=Acer negundo TaxID=4023 RepID=A0AAD5J8G9_ACENE|nr:hypothetical protein LWI28_007385 [Acer negundo]
MDKVNSSVAIIPMSHQFGWSSSVAGLVQSSFFWGYALSQLPGGWLAKGLDEARVEKILDMASTTLNKNSVPGDKSALVPGGILKGSPAVTIRGFTEKEFIAVADFIHEDNKHDDLLPEKQIPVSSSLHSAESSLEVSPRRLERLKLDLNRISDDSDAPPSDLRMEGRLHYNRNGHRSPSPASSSSSMQPSLRNIDLNDRPYLQNDFL